MVKTPQFGPRTFGGLIEEIFNGNNARYFRDEPQHGQLHNHPFQVPVNIKETDKDYNLDVIAPGIAKEDFKLQVNDKTLTISFEIKEEEQKDETKWLRKEFKVKSFKRHFTLGEQVDADKISATYNNGILSLNIPKKEDSATTNKVIDIL